MEVACPVTSILLQGFAESCRVKEKNIVRNMWYLYSKVRAGISGQRGISDIQQNFALTRAFDHQNTQNDRNKF